MNRALKIQFHNGAKDEKPIVTMSLTVNNGKKLNSLDNDGKDNLVKCLVEYREKLSEFTLEIIKSMSNKNYKDKPKNK